ncbi:hypothetical protein LBMAG42_21140 [Deltaproteobacteria bacterium]|nr:hypothetical protein LBMAG42_21140 [Deltaproteobacteria bacterium]
MSSPLRWAIALSLPLAAIGLAVARGKKEAAVEPAPVEAPPPPVEVPPPPAAPALFPAGLPVLVDTLPPGIASLSAQSCNACHWAAHDSWAPSGHARAWSAPGYQAALKGAGASTACLSCHLPLASQHDQLAAGYIDGDVARPRLQDNPAFDVTLMSEGVTCAACHVREGTILGVHASPNSPHPITVSAELSSSELCASCHQLSWPESDRPFYDTYGEWNGSAYAKAGVDCQDCHMAPAAGAPQPGSLTAVPAHASPTTILRALTTLVALPDPYITRGTALDVGITLVNSGAGHSVPTGNPFKTWTIEVVAIDAAGKDLAPPQRTVLARTVEATPPWRTTGDDRIVAGGKKEWTVHLMPNVKGAPGTGALVVRAVRGTTTVELRRIPLSVR